MTEERAGMHTEQSRRVRDAEETERQHDVYPSRRKGPEDRRESAGRRDVDVTEARRAGTVREIQGDFSVDPRRRVGTEREGWRGRLAHVELLLRSASEAATADTIDYTDGAQIRGPLLLALAEIRSMIDGIGPQLADGIRCYRDESVTCGSLERCKTEGCQA